MNDTIIVAAISLLGTIFGSVMGIVASNRLIAYRIAKLEEKVDKHNGLIERTYILEEKVKNITEKIGVLEKK